MSKVILGVKKKKLEVNRDELKQGVILHVGKEPEREIGVRKVVFRAIE